MTGYAPIPEFSVLFPRPIVATTELFVSEMTVMQSPYSLETKSSPLAES